WLDVVLPKDAFAFAIPNAAKRGVVEGAMMKRMGTRAGMPDVCVLYRGRAYFLELKAAKGRVSSNQAGTIDRLAQTGCPAEVVRTIEEAQAALLEWEIPLRVGPQARPPAPITHAT
ncbi:MAG TPA: VRR-NUC domain-containing protein, partial [Bryobacteraceae bacterium]|nr:VRR-NUC domain-containing protein [Bryobacteraceae bacterium]